MAGKSEKIVARGKILLLRAIMQFVPARKSLLAKKLAKGRQKRGYAMNRELWRLDLLSDGRGKKAKIFPGKAEKRLLLLTLDPFVHIFLRPAFDVGACWSVIRSELHVDDSFKEGLVAPCPDRTKSLEFEWKRMIMRFWIRVPWRS
jgi:hypothetical protein